MAQTIESFTHENEAFVKETLADRLKPLIFGYLDSIEYQTPPTPKTEDVEKAMVESATRAGIPIDDSDRSKAIFQVGLSVGTDMYPHHPLDVQVYIGLFTWHATLIDDKHSSSKLDLDRFQFHFNRGERQSSAILESFAEVLRMTYNYYDPVIADFIVLSALAFISANSLEVRNEYQTMRPMKEAVNWPYHYRDKEGLGEAYAYFCFPRDEYSDISTFLPAIPDMSKAINLTNDILSFYKEEKLGESQNYISNRAFCGENSAISILPSVISEATDLYQRSQAVLKGRSPYDKVWHAYIMGYVAFHVKNPYRYKLQELGLGDRYMA